jgi:hypothetical protein
MRAPDSLRGDEFTLSSPTGGVELEDDDGRVAAVEALIAMWRDTVAAREAEIGELAGSLEQQATRCVRAEARLEALQGQLGAAEAAAAASSHGSEGREGRTLALLAQTSAELEASRAAAAASHAQVRGGGELRHGSGGGCWTGWRRGESPCMGDRVHLGLSSRPRLRRGSGGGCWTHSRTDSGHPLQTAAPTPAPVPRRRHSSSSKQHPHQPQRGIPPPSSLPATLCCGVPRGRRCGCWTSACRRRR